MFRRLFTADPLPASCGGQAGVVFLTALSLSAPAFAHPGWPHHTPPVRPSPGNHYMEGTSAARLLVACRHESHQMFGDHAFIGRSWLIKC